MHNNGKGNVSLIDMYYEKIIRYLIKQDDNMKDKFRGILLYIWSLMAYILTLCLSCNILSSLIVKDRTFINSLDEVVESDRGVYIFNNTWLWWHYKTWMEYNFDIDDRLKQLVPKLTHLSTGLTADQVHFQFIF